MSEDSIQLPDYLCFKPSKSKIGQNGLFATRVLQSNEPLGVYRGKIRRTLPQTADEEYVWAILSARGVPVFYIDATNPSDGNFLRFIRWTHDKSQQNVVCMQQTQQIHYFCMRAIQPNEELLTYIARQKAKRREKRETNRTRRETRQQQSTQHQDNPAIKILEQEPGSEFVDDDNVHLVMNNRSLEFELQITKKFLSETYISEGVKQTCLKCDICHQIFMSNVAFKFHYHTYHITPQYLSPANRPRSKVKDSCNICRYSFIANDVKSVLVDLLEVISGGERLQENRYLRLHIYRCHWCAPIDAHYNTAKQLSQHVRSKHYRLLQALLTTQANMLQNGASSSTRGKRAREQEQEENINSIFAVTSSQERTSNVLNSHNQADSTHRLPIPIGLPDPLTDRDCQQLFTIGEQVAYNYSNCVDGTLEDINQNETFCRQQMDEENDETKSTSVEHFLGQYPLVRDLLGARRRQDAVIQHLSDDYFDHPKNQIIDMSKYYQRQKSIPERRFIMNRYICLLCTERFSSPVDLIEHEKLVHEKSISVYDWGCNSIGFLQSNPYAFILELENELKQQQLRTKNEPNSFLTNNSNSLRNKAIRQRSTSSNDRQQQQQEDVKPKRMRREIYRSNTCPTLEVKPAQRKSRRLRKSNLGSPPPSPTPEEAPPVKRELITTMKRLLPSSTAREALNSKQILVKTDKRFYWCTKCSRIYQNLISLYTESHYRQCVGEDQHFNVVHDPAFFEEEYILQQLPTHSSNENPSAPADANEPTSTNAKKKESIFFTKTSDDARTYFINGKPIRMSTINRPVTVKDLRQQFQQQSSFPTSTNPSEEYIYQQRQPPNRSSRATDSTVKVLPTPKSFDTFGISSDEDEPVEEVQVVQPPQAPKPEIEKTFVKRRYDSASNSMQRIERKVDARPRRSQPTANAPARNASRANPSLKRSVSSTSNRQSWKQADDIEEPAVSSEAESIATNRSQIPDALQDYDYVCSKCNMPFVSQASLDEHQNGQCLEMNVLAACGSWFRCPLCSLTYCDANLMSLHINKTHRDVLKSNQRANSQRRSLNRNSQTSSSEHQLRKFT